MQITNKTGVDLYVAALQLVVADGETIDVDADLAEQLALQGWKVATKKPTTKADEADPQEK